MSTPERAGWYDDPEDETHLRYFDGVVWSDHRVPRQSRTATPAPAAETAPQGQPQHAPWQAPGAPGRDVFGRPSGAPAQQPGWAPVAVAGEPTTDDGQPLAGYGARAGAYLIDAVILGILNLVVTGWAWYLWFADYWAFVYDAALAGDPDAVNQLDPNELFALLDMKYLFIATGLSLLLLAVYHVGFLAARSATPGKMAVGLSVRRVEREGRIGAGTAFMRILLPLVLGLLSLLPLISFLTWFVWIADKAWPLKDARRQALHDKIAGTQVVVGRQPRQRS